MYSDSKNLLWFCIAVGVGIVVVVLIALLIKLCLHIYVKRNSMRYHQLKILNANTHFHNVDVEKWSERFDTKKKFDSYGATKFKREFSGVINSQYEKYCEIIKQCEDDLALYDEYLSKYLDIVDQDKNRSQLNGSLAKIEQKILERKCLPSPKVFSAECKYRYTSPAGRNSYSATTTISYNEFLELWRQITKLKHEQQEQKYALQQMTQKMTERKKKLRFRPVEEVQESWIVSAPEKVGLKYSDAPGCYVFLVFDKDSVDDESNMNYRDVYVGQSINVNARVHNHITGKGNGDIFADIKMGKRVLVAICYMSAEELNQAEVWLIHYFDAEHSYNKTKGGATIRQ